MTQIGLVFPGQGSQYVGMGKSLFAGSEVASDLFNKANDILGINISEICFEGPEEELKKTLNTQPAIVATSLVAFELFQRDSNIDYNCLAGHSLGEYSALYASGVLTFESTLKIVKRRAELMNMASAGSMAAILGFKEDVLNSVISEIVKEDVLAVANYNSPDQVVISGTKSAVEKACVKMKEAGTKRAIMLPVSGGFHSPLMKEFANDFSAELSKHNFSKANCPVVTNVDAEMTLEGFEEKLVNQLYSSVLWTQTINKMADSGVDTFIEIGPGKVLSGLIKKINRNLTVYNVEDIASLKSTIEAIQCMVKI